MATWHELQSKLEDLLESTNVYFQPPESVKMKYDAIKFRKTKIQSRYADDTLYSRMNCYEVIVISRMPEHPVIERLLQLPYCSHNTSYKADNLYHDVFTLYH